MSKSPFVPYDSVQFANWHKQNKSNIRTLAFALAFACNQCTAGKSNTQPLNLVMSLDSIQTKRAHKLFDLGRAVRDYVSDLLKGAVSYDAERGRFAWQPKSSPLAAIDWQTVPSFDVFYQAYAKGKDRDEAPKPAKPASLGAILKLFTAISQQGIKQTESMAGIDAIMALLPDVTAKLTAASGRTQDAIAEKAPSVTDGSTGEYSRREAHASASDKIPTEATAELLDDAATIAAIRGIYHPETAAA